ncbi:hypothetical protein LshimejAT787_1005480 [Lyophyllum shimeji]|uniref:Uncharacterized protein n=1 Tax=Lyophyllum shimeji TaxID=47721 RepID=A0A9P3UQS5_LYOSH|nr:hypothetical protein LshimejAT787_1005480 [Lyophyllum shimeji]
MLLFLNSPRGIPKTSLDLACPLLAIKSVPSYPSYIRALPRVPSTQTHPETQQPTPPGPKPGFVPSPDQGHRFKSGEQHQTINTLFQIHPARIFLDLLRTSDDSANQRCAHSPLAGAAAPR